MAAAHDKLGPPAAERDHDLAEYFYESETFSAIASGQATILIGNRGSGKSAIFKIVGEREKRLGAAIINITPEEYSYEFLGKVLKAEIDGAWVKQASYAASWKYVLYVLAMKEATRRAPSTKSASYKAVHGYLLAKFKGEAINVLEKLVSYMKRFEGIKLGSYELKGSARALQNLYQLEEIAELLEPLKDLLARQKVYIFVDELDRGWDGSEDAKQFVAGLFQAAIQINRLTPHLKVFISLRRELYDNIPEIYDDAQKVRDLVREVTWTEEGLRELIGRRIRRAYRLQSNMKAVDCWNYIFAESLSYRKTGSFKYIADRTLFRPREIIQFCNQCIERAGEILIDYEVIAKAEDSYSLARLNDISAEYRFEYPNLQEVFETFRGMVYSLSRTDLETHCLEILTGERRCPKAKVWLEGIDEQQLIGVLWDVGFIRALAIGGLRAESRSGSRYLGVHQLSNLNLLNIHQFTIHPMFHASLGLKEK